MSDTLVGSLIGGVVGVTGSLLIWLSARGKTRADGALSRAELEAQTRQSDITLIIVNLKEQLADLRLEVKGLRLENEECLADRDRMHSDLRRVKDRLAVVERHGEAGEGRREP